MQNFQLALVSIPFSLLGMCLSQYDRERILSEGLLHGYDVLTVLVVLNQAIGGLLIARVVKEADSVSKGFATSFAVICESA
jgi:UDP-sugar transporter A1/2/3